MKIQYTINNYQLGGKLRMCPVHKITIQKRIDEEHTLVVFDDFTTTEKAFTDKVLAKKGLPYGKGFKNYIG